MEILDMKCAQYGSKIADEVFKNSKKDKAKTENLITRSLGVLQEDGVYAFFLYTASKADAIRTLASSFLKDRGLLTYTDGADVLAVVRDGFRENLDNLLFAKELLERTLVYARYHAKALANSKAEETSGEAGE